MTKADSLGDRQPNGGHLRVELAADGNVRVVEDPWSVRSEYRAQKTGSTNTRAHSLLLPKRRTVQSRTCLTTVMVPLHASRPPRLQPGPASNARRMVRCFTAMLRVAKRATPLTMPVLSATQRGTRFGSLRG